MRIHRCIAPLAVLAGAAVGQSIVVPNVSATASTGSMSNTLLREGPMPRTYMQGIAAAELVGLPIGAVITGFSHRSCNLGPNAPSFPIMDSVWPSYDVLIGRAKPLASWTTTFASNFAAPPVRVRTGPMAVEAGCYTYNPAIVTPGVQDWSRFYFDLQEPFVYAGGDLAIYCTHTGNGTTGGFPFYFDAVNGSPTGTWSAYTSLSANATVASSTSNFAVVRIHYGFGYGCAAGSRAPNLVLTNDVASGGNATFAAANGPANALAAFVLGSAQLSTPLPGGCTLWNEAALVVPTTLSAQGRSKISGSFPPGIAGTIVCQLFALDGAAQWGHVTSLGAKLTVSP